MASEYAQFWSLLKGMTGDKEELKNSLVYEFSGGRTVHLHEMSVVEYSKMVAAMARQSAARKDIYADLKKSRSACLHQMQIMGLDTADWDAVNQFCQDARIAGMPFRSLNIEQLESVAVKCRAIRLKSQTPPEYKLQDYNLN